MILRKLPIFWIVLVCVLVIRPTSSFAQVFTPGNCNSATSICDLNYVNATPGAPCSADPDHYVYGKSDTCWGGQSPCVPSCGIVGNGRCCDPNPKNPPNASPTKEAGAILPPPCHGKIDAKGGCSSIDTAVGVIPTNFADVVYTIFRIILGLAGGVAGLLIIAAGYQMMMSQGNPEKVKEARERLTAAIVGLLFIIFSVAILQIIGVDILQIPGFVK